MQLTHFSRMFTNQVAAYTHSDLERWQSHLNLAYLVAVLFVTYLNYFKP